jgi:MFS family permease
VQQVEAPAARPTSPRYKWVALTNTTIGILMVVINGSITIIALPDIFRGIKLDPLQPGNSAYFLWMLMGFLLVTSVLVLTFGRIGDMYGRVRMYNLGFAIFTFFSILLSITWMHGKAGALWLILMRVGQGLGGSLEFANSSAILTDAFPENQRGLALGVNGVAAIAGSFIGLILGGVLAPISWRLVFLVSVPFGIFGTVWAYLKLVDNGVRVPGKIDWKGNVVFAFGLTALLAGVVYGIQPYGHHAMGWTNPEVLGALTVGVVLLTAFVVIEQRVEQPMFKLSLFRIRPFTAGNLAGLLAALARGGLQFMLVIWLQGIWLPQHGYDFTRTPLWAGIYMVPLTVGFLVAGPTSGILSDRFGARGFATGGMIGTALAFGLLEVLPVDFSYMWFALLLLLMGLSMGLFASPNRAAIMNSLPADQRGSGAGMTTTFQNSATVLSIGIFFTVITIGLAASLPKTLFQGLKSAGMSSSGATALSHIPPIGTLFASLLGYNPIQQLLTQYPQFSKGLSPQAVNKLEDRSFFPHLITGPFGQGIHYAFTFAIICSVVAALASLLRGKRVPFEHRSVLEAAEEGMADEGVVAAPSIPAPGR